MKFSIKFYKGCRVLSKADEVILLYDSRHTNLIEYVKDYPQEIRIIVDISTYMDRDLFSNLEIWRAAMAEHPNFAIKMQCYNEELAAALQDVDIPFFIATYIDTFELLEKYVKLGVSDVYICNDLGFSIKKVSKICKANHINVRVYPNIAQSSLPSSEREQLGLRIFFIRPEDLEYYEPYVDIIEFFGPLEKQSVLFEIYKSGKWLSNLSELILGLNRQVNNIAILPDFAEVRLNCGNVCEKDNKCRYCDKMGSFVDTTEKVKEASGYQFRIVKK